MGESTIQIIVTAIIAPVVLLIIQQLYQRRKNKIDYGDNLLDVTNKMSASLKAAREELATLEQEMKTMEDEHWTEMEDMRKQWHEKQERMKGRINELEKYIVKYDISFTLTTHPSVQLTDIKVIGKEDVMASQKMKAITNSKRKLP